MRSRFRTSLGTVSGTSASVLLTSSDAALAFVDAGGSGVTFRIEAAIGEGASKTWGKLGTEAVTVAANENEIAPVTVLLAGTTGKPIRNPTHLCPGEVRFVVTAGSADFHIEGLRLL